MNQGAQPPPVPGDRSGHPGADEQPHGSTGEGAGSAMAKLICQEQARIVPGAPEDPPTGAA